MNRAHVWEHICEALAQVEDEGESPNAPHDQDGVTSVRYEVQAKLLANTLKQRTILVLDNFEGLATSKLEDGLLELVRQSTHLVLVLVSRQFLCLDSPVTMASIATALITEEQLRFTRDEARELAAAYGDLDEDTLSLLLEGTGGWPLAVRAVLVSASTLANPQSSTRRIQPEALSEALSSVIDGFLARMGNSLQRRVFLAAVIYPGISKDSLTALIDLPDTRTAAADGAKAAEISAAISALEAFGLIVQETRSHSTFRTNVRLCNVYRERAQEEFTERELGELARRYARDLQRTQPLEAVLTYVELGDYQEADQVLQGNLANARRADERFKNRIRRIPFDRIASFPTLSSCSLILNLLDPTTEDARIRAMIQQAREGLNGATLGATVDTHHVRGLAARVFVQRLAGDNDAILAAAKHLGSGQVEWSREELAKEGLAIAFLYGTLGFAAVLRGQTSLAQGLYERSLESAKSIGDDTAGARALYGLALCHAVSGEMLVATEFANEAAQANVLGNLGKRDPFVLELAPVQALLAAERGDADELQRIVDELWPIRHRLEAWPLIVLASSEVRRARVSDSRALTVLLDYRAEPRSTIAQVAYLEGRIALQAAKLYMLQGNFKRVWEQLALLPDDCVERKLASVGAALLSGAEERAGATLSEISIAELSARQHCDYLLYSAVFAWRCGEHSRALDDYVRAVSSIRRVCGLNCLTTVPFDTLLELAEAANAAGEEGLLDVVSGLSEHLRAYSFEALSPAELRTLEALDGLESLEQVAGTLFISANTLKFHLRNIYRKLRVASREDAVQRAKRIGLFDAAAE